MLEEREANSIARDAEDAQQALLRVQELLALNHRQTPPIELRQLLDHIHPADAAYVLEALPLLERQVVWQHIKAEDCVLDSGAVLLELSDAVRESLIATMDAEELVAAAEDLDADELADLVPDLPQAVVEEVKQGLTIEEREQLRAAMSYPQESVGARMNFEMVTIRDDVSLEVVLRYLRRFDALPEQTDQVFVIDRAETLKGSLPLDRLLVNEPDTLVVDVMRTDLLTLQDSDDASEAAHAFERYDLVSAPVVNQHHKLVGRLTVNQVVDVIREETQEQVLSQAGLREEEDVFAPVFDSIKNRAPWLFLNLFTASTAAFVASRFEHTVGQIVILAFLMSIVAGIGGNSGNQTMTLIIRALALGRITRSNVYLLLAKELTVSALIGLGGGLVAGGFAYTISGRIELWPVMALAMTANILVGAFVGIAVPLARDRMGKDPAIGSSVLLTFATDTLGFFIFLAMATIFLL